MLPTGATASLEDCLGLELNWDQESGGGNRDFLGEAEAKAQGAPPVVLVSTCQHSTT